jgi:hypothetical protein
VDTSLSQRRVLEEERTASYDFLRDVTGMPFLVLQFDGHGNDAGYLTRCEAYLDSKGLLRCTNHK